MPLRGLALSGLSFLARDYPRKMLETTWFGFDQGGEGALAPILSYGEALALAVSHP
jgi:predicted esterase